MRRHGRLARVLSSDAGTFAAICGSGLTLSKLGEEARVPLEIFSLEGAARADLRQAQRRAIRDGATFEIVTRRRGRNPAEIARGIGCLACRQEHRRETFFPGVLR